MRKTLDRVFCGLMALGAVGHFFGTLKFTEFGTSLFVWSLSGVLAAALIVAFNLLRTLRPGDRAIATVSLVASLSWIGIVVLFGQAIGNVFDPRVVFHGLAALGLSVFSFLALRS